jgi:hypothetical protein
MRNGASVHREGGRVGLGTAAAAAGPAAEVRGGRSVQAPARMRASLGRPGSGSESASASSGAAEGTRPRSPGGVSGVSPSSRPPSSPPVLAEVVAARQPEWLPVDGVGRHHDPAGPAESLRCCGPGTVVGEGDRQPNSPCLGWRAAGRFTGSTPGSLGIGRQPAPPDDPSVRRSASRPRNGFRRRPRRPAFPRPTGFPTSRRHGRAADGAAQMRSAWGYHPVSSNPSPAAVVPGREAAGWLRARARSHPGGRGASQ